MNSEGGVKECEGYLFEVEGRSQKSAGPITDNCPQDKTCCGGGCMDAETLPFRSCLAVTSEGNCAFTETSSSVQSLLNLQQTTCVHRSPTIHPWHSIDTTSIVVSQLAVVPSNIFMLPFNGYSAHPALGCCHINCVQRHAAAVK